MKKCTNCKVSIFDDTNVCPLCRQVLHGEYHEGVEPVYPDLRMAFSRVRLAENIILFLSLMAEAILFTVEYMRGGGYTWSLLVGLCLIYVNAVLRMSIIGTSGYMFKTISGLIFTVAVLYGVDYTTGYRGWSMELVYPAGVLLLNLAVMLLMLINRRNWQSYIMVQLLAVLLSLIPLLLLHMQLIHFPYLALVAFGVSVFYFLGTVIIGDYRARTELRRRFHV